MSVTGEAKAALAAVRREIDHAAAEGRTVVTWWRDDDAVAATPELDRLLSMISESGHAITLAAIPARLQPSLAERVATLEPVTVAVHGWAHADYAHAGEKKAEFGSHRPLATLVRDAARGHDRLLTAFGSQALPVFVPPWNRMAGSLRPSLAATGYRALSCFGAPPGRVGGLLQIDTHLDPIDWRGSRGLAGPDALARQVRSALVAGDRVGLLTHHLVQDEAVWVFCEGWAELAAEHPAIRPIALPALLAEGAAADPSVGPHVLMGRAA